MCKAETAGLRLDDDDCSWQTAKQMIIIKKKKIQNSLMYVTLKKIKLNKKKKLQEKQRQNRKKNIWIEIH